MTWFDPNNKEIEALAGIPYRKDYASLGSEDDTADEIEYRIVFREGDEVCIRGQMDLTAADAVVFSKAIAKATNDAVLWFKSIIKWTQMQKSLVTPAMKLTYRKSKAEFIFDGIPDGNGNIKDYTVVLSCPYGKFSASVSAFGEHQEYDLTETKADFSEEMASRIMRRYLFEKGRMED